MGKCITAGYLRFEADDYLEYIYVPYKYCQPQEVLSL